MCACLCVTMRGVFGRGVVVVGVIDSFSHSDRL